MGKVHKNTAGVGNYLKFLNKDRKKDPPFINDLFFPSEEEEIENKDITGDDSTNFNKQDGTEE